MSRIQGLDVALTAKWLRHCTANAGSARSIPGHGTKIPHVSQSKKRGKDKKKKKKEIVTILISKLT